MRVEASCWAKAHMAPPGDVRAVDPSSWRGVVALGEAILACLTERPMSGYDLAKSFDASVGFFWQADHQQIYRELRRLLEHGDVAVEEVNQTARPNKLVYSITEIGRAALREWSAEATVPRSVKDDLLVRLYALEHVDGQALRTQLCVRLRHHVARLARYEQILEARYSGAPPSLRRTGRLLVLEMGLRQERALADWCRHALEALPP